MALDFHAIVGCQRCAAQCDEHAGTCQECFGPCEPDERFCCDDCAIQYDEGVSGS